ncbi:MAG: hypothetical protein IJG80_09870 [Selenomonadaceae bacterium]|nr:hypothetical protein [Selenomonadaceae bacterium]
MYIIFLEIARKIFRCKNSKFAVNFRCCHLLYGNGKEETIMFTTTFLATVLGDVVAYFIIKWLDR